MSRIRCAIYTRKSSDEGLEQEFNSLEAQREACEAFVASQRGLGWTALAGRYDDGGLSGGTLNRPALQRLLADIDQGRIDLVVVYKVDRLTRSLFDFAKIIQAFEAKNVSFVSVTQQFNTSTSMGRLTLNVLLSFAQFEREVTAERIRDKVAASKQKGMWMGGPVPLGYASVDKKLVVNEGEAAVVRRLFGIYLELRSVDLLKREADRLGLVTKRHAEGDKPRGGLPFSRGNLYQMLHNPIYVGEIAHKGKTYPGQHDGIIARDIWDAVQASLAAQTGNRRSPTNTTGTSILTGKVFDETGDRLSPTSANRNGKRHRYYVSRRLLKASGNDGSGWRIPAQQLEQAVVHGIATLLGDQTRLASAMPSMTPRDTQRLLRGAADLASRLVAEPAHQHREQLPALLHRVTLGTSIMSIGVVKRVLLERTLDPQAAGGHDTDGIVTIDLPVELRRRGVESRLVIRTGSRCTPDSRLMALVARSHRWLDQLTSGAAASLRQIAQAEDVDEADVSRFLPLAFLAPDIVGAIVTGRHPVELTTERLRQTCPLSYSWNKQRLQLHLTTNNN